MKPQVTAIIIHWNTPEHLKRLLKKLGDKEAIQIIVMDNNSDASVEFVKEDFPGVKLIPNQINRGFAAAGNQAALEAEGEWLLFLNPDVETGPNKIDEMVKYARANRLDACSPLPEIYQYDKPLPSPITLLCEFTFLNKLIPLKLFKEKTLMGGCLLIKKEIFQSLRGWDERFFLWFEDSDLTQRLIKGRYRIGRAPVKINHIGGASFNNLDEQYKRDIFFTSMDAFAKKHFSKLGQMVVTYIKRKYTKRRLLPEINKGTSIITPNVYRKLLEDFFIKNKLNLKKIDELIVVSSDLDQDSYWKLKRQYPEIRIICLDLNKGFASTVNNGFRVATGDWVGTVNDDTYWSDDWIGACRHCKQEKTGSINPLIYQENGQVESAGIGVLDNGKAHPLNTLHSGCFEADATNAAAVLYNKTALNEVGLFDEKFGSYLEDIDLSLRLKRKGYKNMVCSDGQVIHRGHASSKSLSTMKPYLDFKNWLFVIVKNWSLSRLVFNFPAIFLERLRNVSGIIKTLTGKK